MASIGPKPSGDSLKSPAKPSPEMNHRPASDRPSLCVRTPQKLPTLPRRSKLHRPSNLPEKYEMIVRFFDALVASLKLLRLRKAIPLFSKIRAMIESMSERRFTHQHLAQLKFLLPELGSKRVLSPDEATRCMKYDLHLTLNLNATINTKKRKRENRKSSLRDCFISRLLQFVRSHPEGTEIPEEELPEPFNQQKQTPLLNSVEPSCSFPLVQRDSWISEESRIARASHISASFRKHFSKGGRENESAVHFQSASESSSLRSPSVCALKPSVNEDELSATASNGTFSAENAMTKAMTPKKLAGTPTKLMASTPALQTPKRCRMSPDDTLSTSPNKAANGQPACARALRFDCPPPSNVNIELQMDSESPDVLDILPASLVLSLKEKEKSQEEQAKRKQMISSLPKLFDRIYYLFQSPKFSAVTRQALIRDLTECHPDITDENEVEQQLTILQEMIPNWISPKLSPTGKILYSINKAIDPNTLRARLNNAK